VRYYFTSAKVNLLGAEALEGHKKKVNLKKKQGDEQEDASKKKGREEEENKF